MLVVANLGPVALAGATLSSPERVMPAGRYSLKGLLGGPTAASLRIGPDIADPEGAWAAQLGIAPDGALLVRPDQHVAWRSVGRASDPRAVLDAALAAILGA